MLTSLPQEEYKAEGVDVANILFRDNQDVIDLISKKPLGLMIILEDQVNNFRRRNGSMNKPRCTRWFFFPEIELQPNQKSRGPPGSHGDKTNKTPPRTTCVRIRWGSHIVAIDRFAVRQFFFRIALFSSDVKAEASSTKSLDGRGGKSATLWATIACYR